jgi:predicted GIY-YIG superfamily endonuclease
MYSVYVLRTQSRSSRRSLSYIGVAQNFERRLREHNAKGARGAKSTRRGGVWTPSIVVRGFATARDARRFEAAAKRRGGRLMREHGVSLSASMTPEQRVAAMARILGGTLTVGAR